MSVHSTYINFLQAMDTNQFTLAQLENVGCRLDNAKRRAESEERSKIAKADPMALMPGDWGCFGETPRGLLPTLTSRGYAL